MNIRADIGKGVIGGALSLTLATIIVKLLGVLYKIPLATVLGDEGMGYFNSAYTVYGFFYLLCTAGVPKSVMILISERLEESKRIVRICISAFLTLGFTLAAVFAIFSGVIADVIGSSDSRATMICVAPSILFTAVAGVLRGYLSVDMKFGSIAVSQILEGAVKLVLGLMLAWLAKSNGASPSVISAYTIVGVTVGSFMGLIYLLTNAKIENVDKKAGQNIKSKEYISVLCRVAKVSVPITVSAALMSLTGMIDLALVMRRLEAIGYSVKEATALYGNYTTLAVSMYNLAIAIITPISVAFMPILARSRASGDLRSFRRSLKDSLDLTSVVSAPVTIGLAVYSKEILSLLFGREAAEIGAPLLVLLIPTVIFTSYLLILNSSLEALARPMLATLSMTVCAAVKVIISGMLLGDPDFGISGAPIGTVISSAAAFLISLLCVSHLLGYAPPVASSMLLPYLLSAIAVLGSRLIYDGAACGLSDSLALSCGILAAALIYIALSVFCGSFSRKKISKIANFTNLY